MGTLERREIITHRLGSSGRLSVKALTGTLRIRGVEGEEARVTVDYRIRATDQASAERALETGRVGVYRGDGSLEVETPERRLSTWLFGGARVGADISVEVPWGAHVRLESMSGSIEADTLVGEQKYRTVSGEIRLWSLGGLVEAGTISGGIVLDRGAELRLKANTISGRIRARATVFHSLNLSTTSGGIAIVGSLDPVGDFRAESISGGVELTPVNGVTAELRTVSGSINSDVPHRMDGSRGSWRAVVGDGRATLKVNTTSGSLRILGAWSGDTPASGPAPSVWTTRVASDRATAPEASAQPDAGGAPDAPAAAVTSDAPGSPPEAETWNPEDGPEMTNEFRQQEPSQEDELEILQALERGEIGVDEAAERLERVRR